MRGLRLFPLILRSGAQRVLRHPALRDDAHMTEEGRGLPTCPPPSSLRHLHDDRHRSWPIAPQPDPLRPLPPSLPPLRPAHPCGLFSCPARANPRLGVSRASRFLVLRKEEQGVGVGQRRQQTGGSEQRSAAVCADRGPARQRRLLPTSSAVERTTPDVTTGGDEHSRAGRKRRRTSSRRSRQGGTE